ncbi:UNVERIFIED_CONTAM: hypothetical protein Slati_3762600 [Sesamum latifolium]|uniref:Uncharacterized protein n=1 Tax=Sesamum latifolium TaxID=2727402 RepID=A0AAW2U3P8_9LAMI
MEAGISRIWSALSLIENEEHGMVLPDGLWHSASKHHHLCLVVRSLSSRVPMFEALSTSV